MSIGPIKRKTSHYGFNIVNFDFPLWHQYEWNNWDAVDALFRTYVFMYDVRGVWAQNTSYAVDDKVIDADENVIYNAVVEHVSSGTGTFEEDRIANPSYWEPVYVVNPENVQDALNSHILDYNNPHQTTKAQVGLGNADNTSDLNKPVSTAQQTALNLKANLASPALTGTPTAPTAVAGTNTTQIATTGFVTAAFTALKNGVAAAGDTLAELYSLITTHTADVANPHATTKAQVGLGNADNTSDANKPVSTAQQTALNLKANLASPTFTGTVGGITKSMVGLGNVDNTADTTKPVSTAQQAALDLKAPIANPTFTGTVGGVTKAMVGLGNVDNTSDANKPVSTAQAAANALKLNIANPTTTGTFTNGGAEVHTSDITPASLAVNTNDYNPTGLSDTSRIRLSASASIELTGLQGGTDGRRIILHNIAAFAITLKDDTTSTAANRFSLNGDIVLSQDQSIQLEYDGTSSRWRAIGGIGGGGSGGGLTDGDKGDVTVGGGGTTINIDANAVTNTKLADMVETSIKGRAVGTGTGDPVDLTAAQATAILNIFTSALKGLVPASNGSWQYYLAGDGVWRVPPDVNTWPDTAYTLARVGEAGADSIGAYIVAQNLSGSNIGIGGAIWGGSLNPARSGSWRAMGAISTVTGGVTNNNAAGLWLRYA